MYFRHSHNGAKIFEKFRIGQNMLDSSQEWDIDYIFEDLPKIFKQLSIVSRGKSIKVRSLRKMRCLIWIRWSGIIELNIGTGGGGEGGINLAKGFEWDGYWTSWPSWRPEKSLMISFRDSVEVFSTAKTLSCIVPRGIATGCLGNFPLSFTL